jgi:hypothetical protein
VGLERVINGFPVVKQRVATAASALAHLHASNTSLVLSFTQVEVTCLLHRSREKTAVAAAHDNKKKEFTYAALLHSALDVTKADQNRTTAPHAPYLAMSPSLNLRILVMTSSIASSGGRKVVLRTESRVAEKWARCDASEVAPDVLGAGLLTESAARNNTNSGSFEKLEGIPAPWLPREARSLFVTLCHRQLRRVMF